ncbi:unnamed protein product, partial [Choristocarpus tenellus]
IGCSSSLSSVPPEMHVHIERQKDIIYTHQTTFTHLTLLQFPHLITSHLCSLHHSVATGMKTKESDVIGAEAVVKVFLLESAFPFNTPGDVVSLAGPLWNSYALAHAGVGFLIEESNQRRVMEYYAADYIGALLPILVPHNSSGDVNGTARDNRDALDVVWYNKANLRISNSFDEALWSSASCIAKITGLMYNKVADWAMTYVDDHPVYQPLSACEKSETNGGSGGNFFTARNSSDSYDFVWSAFDQLARYGLNFADQVVFPPRRTSLCIFSAEGAGALELVNVEGNEKEVEGYFTRTSQCISDLVLPSNTLKQFVPLSYQSSTLGSCSEGGEVALFVLNGLGSCLEGEEHALLYHNSSSYLRMPLTNGSTAARRDTLSGLSLQHSGESDASRLLQHGDPLASIIGGNNRAGLVRYFGEMPPRPAQPPRAPDSPSSVAVGWIIVIFVAASAVLAYKKVRRGGGIGGGGFGTGGAGGWKVWGDCGSRSGEG